VTVEAGLEAVKHDLTHFFQTAEVNCGYTALAMQLSHYGSSLTPEDIYRSAPRADVDGAELPGSLTAQLATWALGKGHTARLTTFDFLIIDLAWASLDSPRLISRLKAVRDSHHVSSLGKALSRTYVDAYVQYLEAGGQLVILPQSSGREPGWLDRILPRLAAEPGEAALPAAHHDAVDPVRAR
jgi:hypothetical protein